VKKVNKYLFISEVLSAPFDEGMKNIAILLLNQLEKNKDVLSITNHTNNVEGFDIKKVRLNKLFINHELRKSVADFAPDVILYLPESSITFNSFIRAKSLKLMHRSSRVAILGVKCREYNAVQKGLIKCILKPDLLFLLSRPGEKSFTAESLFVKVLPPAVDSRRFAPVTEEEKYRIRSAFNIKPNRWVALHVGHVRSTRNIQCLMDIQDIEGVQVVVVDSTSTPTEDPLLMQLVKKGMLVIREFQPDIADIYNMSDIYIFPVLNRIAAIDMPLSVLEAMSCNLPVITSRFGTLVERFEEDPFFRYFKSPGELVDIVKSTMTLNNRENRNREKVSQFSWEKFSEEVLKSCDELVI
jgi:glycosyltransferase involved in cell wall biosynthesis